MSEYVDATNKQCPIPIVMAKKEIARLGSGEITVAVDNETAVQNLQKFAKEKGYAASAEKKEARLFEVKIDFADAGNAVSSETPDGSGAETPACCTEGKKEEDHTVVVLSSDKMGEGDEDLGHVLMKGFIYAIASQDKLPETILLYNHGALLSCEGSASLEDLKSLADAGVEILTCGTCLNHYGLTEKLAVGSVTNMYTITEKMSKASKIIKP